MRSDIDPARQEEIERHAAALESLARKHRQNVLELPRNLLRTEEEVGRSRMPSQPGGSRTRSSGCWRTITAAAARLTQARKSAAESLSGQITELMQALGMAGGVLR
jgi:DNA repair protein RecN (Recombination protein N)